ncbi:enoyl CoA hydratase domain-containing protein 1 [Cladochytrium tenue]|nr:enoyl CoA hydratase domain-containing protein 1 [Cladochytrium tenue]
MTHQASAAAARALRDAFAAVGAGSVTLHLGELPAAVATAGHDAGGGALRRAPAVSHAFLTLRNPARRNALSPRMMAELSAHVDTLEAWARDPAGNHSGLVGVVLAGEGGSFCSGFDLGVAADSFSTPESGSKFSLLMHDTLSRLRALPFISVAAVDGYALGGGAELATACDLRVMGPEASVQFLQVQMGVVPGWQGGTRLTQLLGRSKALTLLAGSERLSALAALSLGYASRVAGEGQTAAEAATEMLDSWASKGYASAIRGVKSTVHAADEGLVSEALAAERDMFKGLWGGPDNLEAIRSHSHRRKSKA